MIHVFFVPGMFGSTVEFVLRNYTKEYSKIQGHILPNGSMHSFDKEFHPTTLLEISTSQLSSNAITTPIYPFPDANLLDVISSYPFCQHDRCLLIHADTIEDAEINCLFQYYKIACRNNCQTRMEIFFSSSLDNVKNWNKSYTSWKDMQLWELREWFSIFYPNWVSKWINSQFEVPSHWKTVKNQNFLQNTVSTFRDIIKFCNLTEDYGLNDFALEWRQAQQYIVDHYHLIQKIVRTTIDQQNFIWTKLNIISESIIQQKLRSLGYEIMCDGLNTFPTSSEHLYKLLIKV